MRHGDIEGYARGPLLLDRQNASYQSKGYASITEGRTLSSRSVSAFDDYIEMSRVYSGPDVIPLQTKYSRAPERRFRWKNYEDRKPSLKYLTKQMT